MQISSHVLTQMSGTKHTTTISPATIVNGLGNLGELPREIRDLIYKHHLSDPCNYWRRIHSHVDFRYLLPLKLNIMRVSRIMSTECAIIFGLKSNVHFRLPQLDYYDDTSPYPVLQPRVTKTLQNITITVNMMTYSDFRCPGNPLRNADLFYQHIFLNLARSGMPRKTCCVRFTECTADQPSWSLLPFFEDLQSLQNFERIFLEMQCPTAFFEDAGTVYRGPLDYFEGLDDTWWGSEEHLLYCADWREYRDALHALL